jgi:lysophospholipase L1-like esterase
MDYEENCRLSACLQIQRPFSAVCITGMETKNFIASFYSLGLILIFSCVKDKHPVEMTDQKKTTYSYLALGDSYTIGESVPATDNFPGQTVQQLQSSGYDFNPPVIVAQTGWTTDELQHKINTYTFAPPYDIVTLLIGVNNQYRGRSVESYKPEFESLLKQAIQFAGGKANHVIVLSIPDWGVTPFAAGRDREQIAKEIDAYNTANKMIADQNKVHYIDITPWTREASTDHSLVAMDGLHPSAKEYRRWAEKLLLIIKEES